MAGRSFLIFDHVTAHPVVYLACARTPDDAVRTFIQEMDGDVTFETDGGVRVRYERTERRYLHVLAYIEAFYKQHGEWQIRELPSGSGPAGLTEAFCGENASDVAYHLAECRKLLRRDVPRSRAPGFLWYLRDGVVVTFYRKAGPWRIEILKRYVRRWEGAGEYEPWTGSHAELMDQLYLGPGEAGILRPEVDDAG
jgi:hypothetical protein